jgi:hypothetical protein
MVLNEASNVGKISLPSLMVIPESWSNWFGTFTKPTTTK